MTALTDLWLGLAYTLGPTIAYLLRGDKKPTLIDERLRNT